MTFHPSLEDPSFVAQRTVKEEGNRSDGRHAYQEELIDAYLREDFLVKREKQVNIPSLHGAQDTHSELSVVHVELMRFSRHLLFRRLSCLDSTSRDSGSPQHDSQPDNLPCDLHNNSLVR